jgi:TonB family protein
MSNTSIFDEDELDLAIDQMIASPNASPAANAPEMAELLDIAADLRMLPRANFKMQLGKELEWEASGRLVSNGSRPALATSRWPGLEFIPTLFGSGKIYPVQRANFAASLALHAAMVAFLFLGLLTVKNLPQIKKQALNDIDIAAYSAPPGHKDPRGGGGGGESSTVPARKGLPPRSSAEQFTPPDTARHLESKLSVEETVIAPDLNPAPKEVGDTFSRLLTLSNGPGANGGVGTGDRGGAGTGEGPGHGPGSRGGVGGNVYVAGRNGVTAPRAIYYPEPEFSEEARRVKYQGIVTVEIVVGADGRPRNLRIERAVGMGLDEKALEAVRTWRFEPGTKDGHPVSVLMNIEVHFNLY